MKKLLATLTIASLILITRCQKDDFVEMKGVCPTVVSTDPANQALNVPINQIVSATFNEEINPQTLTHSSFTLSQGTADVQGTISFSGTTAFFTPSADLASNTTFTGKLTTAIKDLKGNALQVDYVWSFSTGTERVQPMVIATNPASNAVGVFPSAVSATFNVQMNPSTITTTSFGMKQGTTPVAGSVVYSNNTATFVPENALLPNTVYTSVITTAVKDLAGTPLASDYTWSFTTGATQSNPLSVISTDPANNSTNVSLTKIISVNFSAAIDPNTVTAANFTLTEGGTLVSGLVSSSGASASLKPLASLKSNTTYTCSISSLVKDLAGNSLAVDYVWTFSTGTSVSPAVISTEPANNATDVALNQIIRVKFNMPMDPASITPVSLSIKEGANVVAGLVTASGASASFIASAGLKTNTVYTCVLSKSVRNLAGVQLKSDYIWSFTTTATIAAPVVLSTDPINNAVGVVLSKVIVANCSTPMDPLSITSQTFVIKEGGNVVAGTVLSVGSIVTFTASGGLKANTLYTCTLTKGAKSIAGIALENDYVWSFTTLSLNVPPVVISTDPLNNAVGVLLNKVITATCNMPMDPLTINSQTFVVKEGGNVVAGTVLSVGSIVSFTASVALKANTLYTCTLTKGAKSLAGIALENDYVWVFTTLSLNAPVVISTDPINNAVGVLLNKVIGATCNMPMDPLTINSQTFVVKEGGNVVAGTALCVGSIVTFTASAALKANTLYTCTLTKGAKSLTGVALENDYVWVFTTLSLNAPVVISTDPINNAVGVVLNKVIAATCNMPMDPLTINSQTFVVKEGGNIVAGTALCVGSLLTFTASAALKANTLYTCTLTKGAKSLTGVPLENDYVWVFTTLTINAPTIISTDPVNNAVGVLLNKIIIANCSEPMDPASITPATFIVKEGANVVTGLATCVGSTITFAAFAALKANTLYTCTLTKGVKSLAGIGLANDYVWVFTTVTGPPPVVVSTDPLNLAVNVALDKVVKVNFSVDMDPLTVNSSSFTVKEGLTVVAGIVTCNGTSATFVANAALKANTLYTCTVNKGVKSLAGGLLANDHVWVFTTISLTPPSVISTDPVNNAVGVLLNKIITATCDMPIDPSTVTPSTCIVKEGANVVAGLATCVGSVITFTAFGLLKSNTLYTCTLTKGIKNLLGVPLANDYVWSFTTKLTINPPVVDLKSAAQFGILAGVGITSSGLSKIHDMNVGLCPGFRSAVIGFPPAEVENGSLWCADDLFPVGTLALLLQAKLDLSAAITFAQGLNSPLPTIISGDQGGKTCTPGIYTCLSSLLIQSGDLILDAQGDANAVFIIQIASDLTTVGGAGGNIILAGGAQAKNVFWVCGNSAGIGSNTSFQGTLMALSSITMNPGSSCTGRMLALTGSVVLANANNIHKS